MKSLITATLITLLSLTAVAGGHSEKQSDRRMERMIEKLDLSEEQAQQVKTIFDSQKAEREAIREQKKALHDKTNQELSQVLTGEQMDKLSSMQEKRREKSKGKR